MSPGYEFYTHTRVPGNELADWLAEIGRTEGGRPVSLSRGAVPRVVDRGKLLIFITYVQQGSCLVLHIKQGNKAATRQLA